MKTLSAFVIIVLALVAVGVYLSAFIVRQTEQAIVLQTGVR